MKRTHTAALLTLLVVVSLSGTTAATGVNVTISSLDVTPSESIPGGKISIEPTIKNLNESSEGYVIDRVAVVKKTDGPRDTFDQVKNLGTVEAGSTRRVPLAVSFEQQGTRELLVKVWGHSANGGRQIVLQSPFTVEISNDHTQLDIDANNTGVGVQSTGTLTVANGLDAPIENVELTVDGESIAITNDREVLATLENGTSRTVEFNYRPKSAGEHTLEATLEYTTAGGTTESVTESTTINAEPTNPKLTIKTNNSVEGVESEGTVTVTTTAETDINTAELTVRGIDVTVRDDREVLTTVADDDAATTNFTYRPKSAGEHKLTATLSYTLNGGTTRTVTETAAIDADPLHNNVVLDTQTSQNGDSGTLTVNVLNEGNADLSNVTVQGRSVNASVGRAIVTHVPAGASRTVRLNTSLSRARATIDVQATYDIGNREKKTTDSVTIKHVPGTIDLTGIEIVPEQGRLRISGSASNLGKTDAESVLVSVVPTDRVSPSEPNRDYFVGPVPASDFVSFKVYAAVRGNVSTIPLEVSYVVDNERRTRTVEIDARSASRELARQRDSNAEGGSLPVPLVVGGASIVLIGGVGVRAWRSRNGGD